MNGITSQLGRFKIICSCFSIESRTKPSQTELELRSSTKPSHYCTTRGICIAGTVRYSTVVYSVPVEFPLSRTTVGVGVGIGIGIRIGIGSGSVVLNDWHSSGAGVVELSLESPIQFDFGESNLIGFVLYSTVLYFIPVQ